MKTIPSPSYSSELFHPMVAVGGSFLVHLTGLLLTAFLLFSPWSQVTERTNSSPAILWMETTPNPASPLRQTTRVSQNSPVLKKGSPLVSHSILPSQDSRFTTGEATALAPATQEGTYLGVIHSLIQTRQTYPPLAKALGQSGRVEVEFQITADGIVSDVRIRTPSKHARLNQAATELIRSLPLLPPPPEALLTGGAWRVRVPIAYQLSS